MKIRTSSQPWFDFGFRNYQINWGVHVAGLYQTPEERDEILFGFLAEGCRAGDLQLYCPSERSAEEFAGQFAGFCPACEKAVGEPDVLQVTPPRELYYPDGTFSPWHMDDALATFYRDSQKGGRRNIRATAEMAWALEAIPGKEHLMAYESRLNYFIPGKPWISLCLYNLTRFSGAVIMDVLRTHPFVISQGVLTENPYFQDPDVWLEQNAPQFLRRN